LLLFVALLYLSFQLQLQLLYSRLSPGTPSGLGGVHLNFPLILFWAPGFYQFQLLYKSTNTNGTWLVVATNRNRRKSQIQNNPAVQKINKNRLAPRWIFAFGILAMRWNRLHNLHSCIRIKIKSRDMDKCGDVWEPGSSFFLVPRSSILRAFKSSFQKKHIGLFVQLRQVTEPNYTQEQEWICRFKC